MKLLKVIKSSNSKKKWTAIFDNGTKTDFGGAGSSDYTLSGDKKERDLYRKRHLKDLLTNDPTRAGYLSYFILWGNHTDINKNINDYKIRFNMG